MAHSFLQGDSALAERAVAAAAFGIPYLVATLAFVALLVVP